MIQTLSFALTKKEYFRLLLTRYFKKKWWLFLVLLALGGLLFSLSRDEDSTIGLSFICLAFVLPAWISYALWRHLSSKANKVIYLSRYYEMDFDTIKGFLEDGSTSSTRIANFVKSELIGGYHLLFISKTQYFLVPLSCFKSAGDYEWFKNNILGKISMPGFL